MFALDRGQLFGIEKSIVELVLRGTVMYWFLFVLFRFVMRRDIGAIGIADVLLVVIIADAAQNAMSDDYRSITEGMIVVGTLVLWNVFTNWLSFHWRGFARFAEPPPLILVRDGRILARNLRREMMTEAELLSKLREQSVESVDEVAWAYMEADGQISLRRRDEPRPRGRRAKRTLPAGR